MAEAKRLSAITHEENISMIKMLNAVKSNYERLSKRVKENSEYIMNLANLKIMIRVTKL